MDWLVTFSSMKRGAEPTTLLASWNWLHPDQRRQALNPLSETQLCLDYNSCYLSYIIFLNALAWTQNLSMKDQICSQFILFSYLWFLGWLLEWRGEVREHRQLCERQQRHLRPAEQNLHRHYHPGESMKRGKKNGICVRIGKWAEKEGMKGRLTFYFNWNFQFLKVENRLCDHIARPPCLLPGL